MSANHHYPTDLTEEQWDVLHCLLPPRAWRPGGRGRPPSDVRRIIDGILYLNKTGCQWRMIPPTFGNWSTIYGYFKHWQDAMMTQTLYAGHDVQSITHTPQCSPNMLVGERRAL